MTKENLDELIRVSAEKTVDLEFEIFSRAGGVSRIFKANNGQMSVTGPTLRLIGGSFMTSGRIDDPNFLSDLAQRLTVIR